MDFQQLTAGERRERLVSHIKQHEAAYFDATVNATAARAAGRDGEAANFDSSADLAEKVADALRAALAEFDEANPDATPADPSRRRGIM